MRTTVAVLILSAAAFRAGAAPASEAERLHAFLDRQWEREIERDPVTASIRGDRRGNNLWPDLSLQAIARDHERQQAAWAELQTIDRSRLPGNDRVNYDLFAYDLQMALDAHGHEWYLVPANTLGGIHTTGNLANRLRFETVKDYEDWIVRLTTFPAVMDQTLALMQRGIERDRLPPKVVVARISAQVGRLLAEEPARTLYYKPFTMLPATFTPADRERLADAGREAIEQKVIPALQRFNEFLQGPYMEAAPETVGLGALKGGEALYAHLVRVRTTTPWPPSEIHELGQREVARISAELETAKHEIGFAGSLPEFLEYLRTDPKFEFKGPDDVLTAARACAKRIDPTLVRLFRTLPRMPYGVEAIPPEQAADAPASYVPPAGDGSRAGFCRVNTLRPSRTWLTTSLLLHESVPGHHLQAALALEQSELPNFRRYGGYTAFTEGWGLYAEFLGDELGLYADPYQKIGRLVAELARAVRLVVDTGLHHLGWDRAKAYDYLRSRVPMGDAEIAAEVDRCIAMPAQALAYKIGELKIKELRRRAAERLGARFDVKAFHDVVLLSGSVPLEVLERNVDAWIADPAAH